MSVFTAAATRQIDARCIAEGTPGSALMLRAAEATWAAILERWADIGRLTVLTGKGNNAGDGFLIALLAVQQGWSVRILTVGDPQALQGDARQAWEEARSRQLDIRPWSPEAELTGVLVDALLGTGLTGTVREPFRQVIEAINASGLPVCAVDIPSGLSADTGAVLGVAVQADLTVTFIALKLGLLTGTGPDCVGRLVFADLQVEARHIEAFDPAGHRLDSKATPQLAARTPGAHKGCFGQLMVIGGDRGTGGAALMAAEAALRTGAGMVSLLTRPEHVPAALVRCPEIMSQGLESSFGLEALWARTAVLVIGPGLGLRAWGRALLSAAPRQGGAQVWDADALNLLAEGGLTFPAGSVMTPHPGEAARLLGCSIAEIQQDRPAAVWALAARHDAVVVLKGAGSLIADPQGRLWVCDHGHPAMAGPGLGDVLSGVIGALLAQGLDAGAAARLGVWLHARAGEQLGRSGRGLAATDLIPCIRQLLEEHSPCLPSY